MVLFSEIFLILTDYIMTVLSFIAAILLIHCFYDDDVMLERKDIISSVIITAIAEIGGLLNSYVFDSTDGFSPLYLVSTSTLLLPCLYKVARMKHKRFKRLVRIIVTMVSIWIVSYSIGNILLYLLEWASLVNSEYINERKSMGIMHITTLIITAAMIYYLNSRYVKKSLTMPFRIQDKIFTVLYVISCGLITHVYNILYLQNIDLSQGHDMVRVFFVMITVMISIVLPILILRNRQTKYFNNLSLEHEKFLEAELAASQQYKEAQDETKAFRHDVKNNLNVVSALMNEGKFEEAEQYLLDMQEQVAALSPKVVTGDEMLDALISTKLTKMTEDSIVFTTDGVAAGGMGWRPIDICTVFANALDNAIEACEQVEDEAKRFIKLDIKKTKHQRLISLSNSTSQDVDCEKLIAGISHFTTKKEKSLHGYGVRNIRRTIEKYGGMMELSCENGTFTMSMILNLDSQTAAE